jgi:hypothetical protein
VRKVAARFLQVAIGPDKRCRRSPIKGNVKHSNPTPKGAPFYNVWNRWRKLAAISSKRDIGHSLVQERDEASGPAHIFLVRLAQSRDECGFLNGYAVCIGSTHAGKKGKKPCPVSERQTQSDERDESAGVGGMADVAVRSHVNDRLASVNRYIVGKKPPQNRHGVETKSHPREHERDSDEEERSSLPQYGCLWEEKRERKV